jgi:hypothetical protein
MNKLMRFVLLILCFFQFAHLLSAQDWLKNSIPSDIKNTCLIVEKLDSAGMKCRKGRVFYYCNSFDKETDSKLLMYQKQHELLWKEYKLDYVYVHPKGFPYQEYTDFSDLNKYRYILKFNTVEASDGSDITYHWVYYFFDRKTNKALPRIKKISEQRLKSLKEIIETLNTKFAN